LSIFFRGGRGRTDVLGFLSFSPPNFVTKTEDSLAPFFFREPPRASRFPSPWGFWHSLSFFFLCDYFVGGFPFFCPSLNVRESYSASTGASFVFFPVSPLFFRFFHSSQGQLFGVVIVVQRQKLYRDFPFCCLLPFSRSAIPALILRSAPVFGPFSMAIPPGVFFFAESCQLFLIEAASPVRGDVFFFVSSGLFFGSWSVCRVSFLLS